MKSSIVVVVAYYDIVRLMGTVQHHRAYIYGSTSGKRGRMGNWISIVALAQDYTKHRGHLPCLA